jgi:heme-degrading monooxygenase HmoA
MTNQARPRWGYMIVWEFRPRKGAEAAFEDGYGAHGVWARLFERGAGFVGTELNRDLKDPSRYLTLDFWVSKEAYDAFRAACLAEYQAIDEQCESLTEYERELGRFERLGS